jgi:hypothetical protein
MCSKLPGRESDTRRAPKERGARLGSLMRVSVRYASSRSSASHAGDVEVDRVGLVALRRGFPRPGRPGLAPPPPRGRPGCLLPKSCGRQGARTKCHQFTVALPGRDVRHSSRRKASLAWACASSPVGLRTPRSDLVVVRHGCQLQSPPRVAMTGAVCRSLAASGYW